MSGQAVSNGYGTEVPCVPNLIAFIKMLEYRIV